MVNKSLHYALKVDIYFDGISGILSKVVGVAFSMLDVKLTHQEYMLNVFLIKCSGLWESIVGEPDVRQFCTDEPLRRISDQLS